MPLALAAMPAIVENVRDACGKTQRMEAYEKKLMLAASQAGMAFL